MKNKGKILILIMLLILASTSCKNSDVDSDGTLLNLTMKEIEAEERTGFFILSEDNLFTPLMQQAQGYQGEISGYTPDIPLEPRFLWFNDNIIKISKLIPKMGKKDKLVFIYNENSSLPLEFTLEKYDFKGYTIGCHIYRAENNSLYISTEDTLLGSDAENKISKVSDEEEYKISTINKNDKLPISNIDNNMRLILGLEKDKHYTFSFYKGTSYIRLNTVADSFVFQSSQYLSLQNPYTTTKKGYFIVNLPENLENGYYYICGLGLFQYVG